MKKSIVLLMFSATFVISGLIGCTTLEQYKKVHLNDSEMDLNNRGIEVFESDFQSYREGAVGGHNGNAGAGCGCN